MAITSLDHVNIRTTMVGRSLAFYRDVLGLEIAPAPGAADLSHGGWVMLDDRAIIHVGSEESAYPSDDRLPFVAACGGGAIHHVAFRCLDHAGMFARLAAAGLPVDENVVEAIGLRQLFVQDPDGVLIELNFWQD